MIVISFALPEESSGIVRRIEDARRSGSAALPVITGRLAGWDIVVVHAGMGMTTAAANVTTFLDHHAPAAWIAAGFGGALAPDLGIGDIVASENFSDASLFEAVAALPRRAGRLITVNKVIETKVEKQDLARHTGAIAVDMETAAIHRVCASRSIPVLALRAISDTAAQEFPVPTAAWFDVKAQRPRPIRLVLYLLTHPARIAPFVRFVRGINLARARLTDFLLAVLERLPEK